MSFSHLDPSDRAQGCVVGPVAMASGPCAGYWSGYCGVFRRV